MQLFSLGVVLFSAGIMAFQNIASSQEFDRYGNRYQRLPPGVIGDSSHPYYNATPPIDDALPSKPDPDSIIRPDKSLRPQVLGPGYRDPAGTPEYQRPSAAERMKQYMDERRIHQEIQRREEARQEAVRQQRLMSPPDPGPVPYYGTSSDPIWGYLQQSDERMKAQRAEEYRQEMIRQQNLRR